MNKLSMDSKLGRRQFLAATASLVGVAATSRSWADALPVDDGSWTLALLPDTQVYARAFPKTFDAQTRWIVDHATSHNIKYVLHEGDITDNNVKPHWDNALHSMNILTGAVPYAMAPGNHDYGPNGGSADRVSDFNEPRYFGHGSKYAAQPSLGGCFEKSKTDNSFHTFEAGGNKWLVLALEFGPRDEVVAWANKVVEQHPDHLAMLVTHAYMYYDDTRYDWKAKGKKQDWNPHAYALARVEGETVNDGQQLWDKLIAPHKNFRFAFNGHVLVDGTGYLSSRGPHGNVVHQLLANYQFKKDGGQGDMRLLEFKPDGQTVVVRTYSPLLDRYDTAYDQAFTLNMNELHPSLGPPVKR